MDSVYLDYYHPYAGLCNQLYLITNHIYESFRKKTKIYIHKINIDIFKKCRVPAGEVLDLVKTNDNLKKILGYDILDLVAPIPRNIPRLCIYPVSSVEILNCLEFNPEIVLKVPKGNFNTIHFRLDIDCIISNLFGEEYYSYFMENNNCNLPLAIEISEIVMNRVEVIEYIELLMKEYFQFILLTGFDKEYYICTSIGKSIIHDLLLPHLKRITDFIISNGGKYFIPKGEYSFRELNALVDLIVLRDSYSTIGFEGSSFSEGYAFKVGSIRNPNKKYYFVNGFVEKKLLMPGYSRIHKNIAIPRIPDNSLCIVQIFANEYSSPGDNVLILGDIPEITGIVGIFNFINCEVITVGNYPEADLSIPKNGILPFEEYSFNIILNNTNNTNINAGKLLITNGKLLNIY